MSTFPVYDPLALPDPDPSEGEFPVCDPTASPKVRHSDLTRPRIDLRSACKRVALYLFEEGHQDPALRLSGFLERLTREEVSGLLEVAERQSTQYKEGQELADQIGAGKEIN